MSVQLAIQLGIVIAAVGIVIDSAEMMFARDEIQKYFGWKILSTALPSGRVWSLVTRSVGLTTKFKGVPFQAARAGFATAAAAAAIAGNLKLAALLALFVALAQIGGSIRLLYGLDGADQMQTVLWCGFFLSGVIPAAGLSLIAGQSLLSYLVAGTAKLGGGEWRHGTAPVAIAATIGYGGRSAHDLIGRLSYPLAIATMVFEVTGPLAVVIGPLAAAIFCASAVGFHAGIAITMRLNNFFWSFTAALPAVYWLSFQLPWS
jgi:uncharacterized membrane protein YphA (DoxX/SURF4 family)